MKFKRESASPRAFGGGVTRAWGWFLDLTVQDLYGVKEHGGKGVVGTDSINQVHKRLMEFCLFSHLDS